MSKDHDNAEDLRAARKALMEGGDPIPFAELERQLRPSRVPAPGPAERERLAAWLRAGGLHTRVDTFTCRDEFDAEVEEIAAALAAVPASAPTGSLADALTWINNALGSDWSVNRGDLMRLREQVAIGQERVAVLSEELHTALHAALSPSPSAAGGSGFTAAEIRAMSEFYNYGATRGNHAGEGGTGPAPGPLTEHIGAMCSALARARAAAAGEPEARTVLDKLQDNTGPMIREAFDKLVSPAPAQPEMDARLLAQALCDSSSHMNTLPHAEQRPCAYHKQRAADTLRLLARLHREQEGT